MSQINNNMDTLGLPQDLIWDSDQISSLANITNARYKEHIIFPDNFAYGMFIPNIINAHVSSYLVLIHRIYSVFDSSTEEVVVGDVKSTEEVEILPSGEEFDEMVFLQAIFNENIVDNISSSSIESGK